MIIYLGADHRGFKMKNDVKYLLKERGYEVVDLGPLELVEGDDYTDYGALVADKIRLEFEQSKGVLICGSGAGMGIIANKYPNVRAAVVHSPDQAFDVRKEDDANVLVLASQHTEMERLKSIVMTFFETPFDSQERYLRRIKKIGDVETKLLHD